MGKLGKIQVTKKQGILAGAILVAVLLLAFQRRHRNATQAVVPPPAAPVTSQPAPKVARPSSPIEVVPAEVELAPGGKRLFFARMISPGDKNFHYDSNLFIWKMQEKDGGTLKKNGASRLYYTYTAPKTPGTYHVLVGMKNDANVHTVVPITVGSPAAKPAADPRRPASVNKGAALPQ